MFLSNFAAQRHCWLCRWEGAVKGSKSEYLPSVHSVLPLSEAEHEPIPADGCHTARAACVEKVDCYDNKHGNFYLYTDMMKKTIFFAYALIACLALQAQENEPYTILLQDAYWNFDSYDNTKMNCTSELQLVPRNWIVGSGGTSKNSAAYIPFIYPVSTATIPDQGYDGRLCIRIYDNSTVQRTPGFAVLPLITDAVYDTLALTFYGRGEVELSSTGVPYHRRLCIGYITQLDDTLKANFKTNVILFRDTVMPSVSAYSFISIPLRGVPAGARIALYNDEIYPDSNNKFCNSVLLDNIAFVGTGEPLNPGETTAIEAPQGSREQAAKKILRNGQLFLLQPDGSIVTSTGQRIR